MGERQRVGGAQGATLFEVMVALALLAGAVVALANLFTVASRSNSLSRSGTTAAQLAGQKMEQLHGLAWGYRDDGTELTDATSNVCVSPEAGAGGTGLGVSPPGTLFSSVPGFVDYVDHDGGWVGTGSSPPPAAAYVRRWSIDPLPASPGDTLVFRVAVFRRGTEAGGRGVLGGRFDVALLTSVKTRRAP